MIVVFSGVTGMRSTVAVLFILPRMRPPEGDLGLQLAKNRFVGKKRFGGWWEDSMRFEMHLHCTVSEYARQFGGCAVNLDVCYKAAAMQL